MVDRTEVRWRLALTLAARAPLRTGISRSSCNCDLAVIGIVTFRVWNGLHESAEAAKRRQWRWKSEVSASACLPGSATEFRGRLARASRISREAPRQPGHGKRKGCSRMPPPAAEAIPAAQPDHADGRAVSGACRGGYRRVRAGPMVRCTGIGSRVLPRRGAIPRRGSPPGAAGRGGVWPLSSIDVHCRIRSFAGGGLCRSAMPRAFHRAPALSCGGYRQRSAIGRRQLDPPHLFGSLCDRSAGRWVRPCARWLSQCNDASSLELVRGSPPGRFCFSQASAASSRLASVRRASFPARCHRGRPTAGQASLSWRTLYMARLRTIARLRTELAGRGSRRCFSLFDSRPRRFAEKPWRRRDGWFSADEPQASVDGGRCACRGAATGTQDLGAAGVDASFRAIWAIR